MNKISYYDNVVPIALRQQIHDFCLKSTYKLGWEDLDNPEDPSKYIPNQGICFKFFQLCYNIG